MPFVIVVESNSGEVLYVKRTAHFGAFYGNMVFTKDVVEAFRFTREKDARVREELLRWRMHVYETEQEKFPGLVGIKKSQVRVQKVL